MAYPSSSGGGRQKWRFVSYHLVREGEDFVVKDETQVLDARTDEYRSTVNPAGIALTAALRAALATDPSIAYRAAARMNALRRELDRRGVKVFFDVKRETGKIYPKWKYWLHGRAVAERIFDVPDYVLNMVRDDVRYFESDEYRKWYGPRLQRKRESLIAADLAAAWPDPEQTPPEHEALKRITAMLAEKSAPLFELPAAAPQFMDWTAELAANLFRQKYGEAIPTDDMRRVIEAALRRHMETRMKATA